jgi:hypothetical protein
MAQTSFEKVEIVYENGQLKTIAHYPKKGFAVRTGGVEYDVGSTEEYAVTQICTKENIPILLQYLNEQFAYVNDRLKTSTEQLELLKGIDDKFIEIIENFTRTVGQHLSEKDIEKLLRTRAPVLNELAVKVQKKAELKKTITDLTPTVAELKNQVELVMGVISKNKLK